MIDTLQYAAQVLPRNAAHIVFSCDGAGKSAVDDLSTGFVDADDSPNIGFTLNTSRDSAVSYTAAVVANQPTQGILEVCGFYGHFQGHILHHSAGLQVTKQSPHVAAACYGKPGDGVSLPIECAAKGGDGREFHIREIKVRR